MAGNFPRQMEEGARDEDYPEPPRLRRLRWMVNALSATLIVGFIIIVVTLVTRLSAPMQPVAVPETLSLPAGERAGAVTLGSGWVAVVTRDAGGAERIRVFDSATGAPRAVTLIAPLP